MNKEKKPIPFDKITLAMSAVSLVLTVILYSNLPERIPYHWSITGNVKTAGKWITLITAALPAVIFYVIKLRPKKNQTLASAFAVSLLFLVVHWAVIIIAKYI